jgi:hypothetical protein
MKAQDFFRHLPSAFCFLPSAFRLPWVFLGIALCLLPLPVASAQAPAVSLTPDQGPAGGGTRVLIEIDEGLTLGSIRVEFDGRPVRVLRGLGLSIVEVITPPGNPGPVPVRVTYGLLMKTAASGVFTYVSPAPRLARLDPSTVQAGSEELPLSVEGEDFTPTCGLRVGDTGVPTTVLSPQRLQVRVPTSLLARAGNLEVRVIDSAVGGGTSNVVPLAVVNPPPQLTAVEAPPLRVGGDTAEPVRLTARGRAFRPESFIQLAGAAAPTQYRSGQELTAIIPPGLLAKPGELPVVVVTPGPGGGTSRPLSLSVVAPFPGRFLVFTSNRRGGRNHIYLLDRQTGHLDPLEEANSGNGNDDYPSISADGRFIVFQSDRREGQFHIFLFDRETRRLDPLPELNHSTAFDGFPHISPDGRFIVFESDRLNGRPKVFLYDRKTQRLSELHQANEATADDGLAAISN